MTRDEHRAVTQPIRLQLSRRKGFNLQEHSRAVNGLMAVNVARPSVWGNPYRVGVDGWTAQDCVAAYRLMAKDWKAWGKLRGKNLACWCGNSPCHADVLLELANPPEGKP